MKWDTASPPPASMQSWLAEQGSLTERLGRTFGQPVQVQVLGQGEGVALPHEAAASGADSGWIREVVLFHQPDRPLLWARTFVPHMDSSNPWHIVRNLGEKPLGALIFTLEGLKRGRFHAGLAQHPAKMGEAPLWHGHWGRWHRLEWRGAPLVLTEVMLFDE